jgi:hypothetical protein
MARIMKASDGSDAARITMIANYIIDKAEAGWSLQDIIDAVLRGSNVTLADFQAALAEAFHDDTSVAVKRLAEAEFDRLIDEVWHDHQDAERTKRTKANIVRECS